MKLIKIAGLLMVFVVISLYGQSGISGYQTRSDFMLTSPGAMGVGLYGYENPAMLTHLHQVDLLFTLSDETGDWNDFNRWGLFTAVPNFGFGMIRESYTEGDIASYKLSFSGGNRRQSFGFGYGWSSGGTDASMVTLGSLLRPNRYLSIGLIGNLATSGGDKEGIIDLGVRPFGNERVTLFGDYVLQNEEALKDANWSAGAAMEVLPGVRLTGRYFNNSSFTVGLNLSFGHFGVNTQAHTNKDQEYSHNTYGIRVGALDRTLFGHKEKYVKLDLLGPVKYQRYRLFDESNTLSRLISIIDNAKKDKTVSGIAINASGMEINPEIAWELRERLKDFKSSGKHVVIFIDNAGTIDYYFASVADKVVLDPTGSITLKGFLFGRMYLKGTLEKLGIGFDELRFFKYKSAAEILSRESMSEGDREQGQKLIDDWYELWESDICDSRGFTIDEFDELVNEDFSFMPKDALEKGLIDALGRWDAVKDMIKDVEGKELSLIGPDGIVEYRLPKDNCWGEPPRIAVIYALGECAMDTGIKARKLVKDIESVTRNSKIKAVVFRVDSPGGAIVPSDIVAEALKKCTKEKPVIVSQGWVAGSGGYWISMYGDTIVAAPNTITGSIGVIGGWIYNKGLKEKLGMTTDFVKKGKHADLGFGVSLPFVGYLPDRNLSEEERAIMEDEIKTYYKMFVEKVASGRNKKYEEIDSIAQGRVWTGLEGKRIGLVDELGGLWTAIMIAREKVGIPDDREVKIVELPKKGLFSPEMFQPKLLGAKCKNNELLEYLKLRLENNGKVMPIIPLEDFEAIMRLGEAK